MTQNLTDNWQIDQTLTNHWVLHTPNQTLICTYIAREWAKFLVQLINDKKITEHMYGIASSCREFKKVWIKQSRTSFPKCKKKESIMNYRFN